MATDYRAIAFSMATDALFDAIGAALYDVFVTTFGWVEKADTGRTDWSTNPACPSAGTYLWNIYGPNDALQTGSTIYYVKVEVGKATGTTNPKVRVQIGTGTDGSGTLTGVTSTQRTLPSYGAADFGTTLLECYASGDTGRIGLLWFKAATNGTWFFGIERTLDSDGTPNSDGVTLCNSNYQLSQMQTILFGVGAAPTFIQQGMPNSTGAYNGSIAVTPAFPMYGRLANPMTVAGAIYPTDIAECAILQCTLYGVTRRYLCSADNVAAGPYNSKLMMRYD